MMSDEQSTDESTDSQQESEQQPTDSDQPAAQSDDQSAEQNDQSTEQSEVQPAESEQPTEQPTDETDRSTEQSGEQAADTDQQADQSEVQPAESDQPQSEEQPTASDQATGQGEEQPTESDQPAEQSDEQPADSDQSKASASADNTLAFAGGTASPGGGGPGVQARPGGQPTRSPRAPVPQAPVKHDFAVRFTFLTSLRGFLAKGFYRFEISSAEGGTMLATHDWSPVSVTVPLVFKFSLTQITRYGEKIPSFDFYVSLSWLPFSTTSQGTPADPNDTDYADMIKKDSRIVTTLRPKDNSITYLTIPPAKGTAVTKIDLHCSIAIMDEALRAPSTDENDFIAALFNRGVNLDQLVEKGPPQQSTKDGVNTFLYEIKYYGAAIIEEATVLP
jgi:hypothetical protein